MKKKILQTFIQLLRTKTTKNKIKTNIVKKTQKKKKFFFFTLM
jgi:hypothetical protein